MQSLIIDQVKPVLKKYGVTKASLFGSHARNTSDHNSDVDILIQPPQDMGLSFIYLQLELEKKLNKKVDLVSYDGINKHLEQYILENQVKIL